MSARTYREAAARFREALDLLGPYAGPCGLCGAHPDRRHRQADAITGALLAGERIWVVADDYLNPGTPASVAWEVAVACLAADRRRHGLTRYRAAELDRDVWGC